MERITIMIKTERTKKIVLISAMIVAVTVCSAIVLFEVTGLIKKVVLSDPQNVFEEIYYTQTRYGNHMPSQFSLHKEALSLLGIGKWIEFDDVAYCMSHYWGSENQHVVIECYKSPEKQVVIYYYEIIDSKSTLICSVLYSMEKKTITSEYTDCSFLYEILLPAWFDGMGERSDFTIDNLGEFTDMT